LATAVAVDSEFSKKTKSTETGIDIGADFAYAGDLYGNLWRFDFSSDNPGDWQSSIKRIVKADNIMYRPITVQPRVLNLPANIQSKEKDVIVMFGTGKYIEIPDRNIELPTKQYMVGIVDGLASTNEDIDIDDVNIQQQSLTEDSGVDVRHLGDNTVDLNTKLGWKVQLPEKGERLANPLALLSNVALVASTIVTAGSDPCNPGGRSWITAFDPFTGGTIKSGEPFQKLVDKDGNQLTEVMKGDSVLVNDIMIGGPKILEKPGSQQIVLEGSETVEIISLKSYTWRRRNWTNLLTE
jgi:type IV pilus assembly protein PilY1